MTSHRSTYRQLGRRLCRYLLPLGLALQLQAQGTGTYVGPDLSKVAPIRLDIVQQSGSMGERIVQPTNEGIEIQMLQGDGAIVVGWDHMDQFQINLPMTESLNRALTHPEPAKRAELLRPEIEPVLSMAGIPPGSTNIHILINKYIKANIDAGNWLKAYETSQKMALDRSAPDIVQNYYVVAVNLFIEGEREKALKLLDQLVAARPVEESRKQTMQVAKRLSDERVFEPSFRLFRNAAVGAEGVEGKNIVLRCAYLCLELNDPEGADRYLAQAQAIDEDDTESRGAYQLVLGVKAFQSGDPEKALNYLGLALAEVAPNSSYKQVGLYFNFLSYSNLRNEEIAKNILAEMTLLFPKGAYTTLLVGEPEDSSPELDESTTL